MKRLAIINLDILYSHIRDNKFSCKFYLYIPKVLIFLFSVKHFWFVHVDKAIQLIDYYYYYYYYYY